MENVYVYVYVNCRLSPNRYSYKKLRNVMQFSNYYYFLNYSKTFEILEICNVFFVIPRYGDTIFSGYLPTICYRTNLNR